MTNTPADPAPGPRSRGHSRVAPHRIALVLIWVAATAAIVATLLHGVRSTDQYSTVRHVLHSSYVAALLWHLARTGSSVRRLPDLAPQILPRRRYGAWVPVLGVALVLFLTAVSDDGVGILMLLLIAATAWILLVWRREIRLRSVLQGTAVALAACLAGLPLANNGFVGRSTVFLLSGLSAPMYVAGGLLFDRTRLGGAQIIAGRYGEALKGVFRGALFFVPLGLVNAADGAPGTDITWVTEWWLPISLPWFSGIAEETWFRLFLVGLCYFLLRPAFVTHPTLAVTFAILFSGITFGLGHGRTLEGFLTTGLLYGVPLAATFARRDWEHAVGAHYMINMIPWWTVFLEA